LIAGADIHVPNLAICITDVKTCGHDHAVAAQVTAEHAERPLERVLVVDGLGVIPHWTIRSDAFHAVEASNGLEDIESLLIISSRIREWRIQITGV
jgi:hypothetical protein